MRRNLQLNFVFIYTKFKTVFNKLKAQQKKRVRLSNEKLFLKKEIIPFVFPNKHIPLHPVNKKRVADIAQLVEQRIRNA